MGIAVASATVILVILAVFISVMACRNKKKAKYNSNDGQGTNLSNFENSQFHSGPKSDEHAWAYSNTGMDVMGDEGIEVDLDQNTEEKMKHLAETFNSSDSTLGSYQVGDFCCCVITNVATHITMVKNKVLALMIWDAEVDKLY